MTILFYCPWHNRDEWLKKIRKTFKDTKIVTLKDKLNFPQIKYAIIWDLPDDIYKKLTNLRLLFLEFKVIPLPKLAVINKLPADDV